MQKKQILVILAATLGLFGAGASAATVHAVSGSNGGPGISGCDSVAGFSNTSGDTISGSFFGQVGACTAGVSAVAGGGKAGLKASYRLVAGAGGPSIGEVRGSASATYDFTITTPANYTGGLIPVSVSADIHGRLIASVQSTSPFSRSAGTFLEGRVDIRSGSNRQNRTSSNSANASNSEGDEITTVNVDNTLTTPTMNVDPSQTITVTLGLSSRATAAGYGDSAAFAETDALNTLSFTANGPVFNLPEGFSINSVDANVIDNLWVGAVPIPGLLPLYIGSLGLLAYRRGSVRKLTQTM